MNNKILLILVIFLTLAVWDFNARLGIDVAPRDSQESNAGISIPKPNQLSEKQLTELRQQYLNYDGQKNTPDPLEDSGMSLAEQNKQQGRLDQLYAGDLRIRLQAVIRQPSTNKSSESSVFALLSVQNIKETSPTTQKVKNENKLYGYSVQSIQLNQITLASIDDPSRVINLAIYQKRSAATPESSPESSVNRKSQ